MLNQVKILLLAGIGILCTNVWSDTSPKPEPSIRAAIQRDGFQSNDASAMLNMTKAPEFKNESDTKIKFSASCSDDSGKKIEKGDQGFDDCMQRYKLKQQLPGGRQASLENLKQP